ncbi:MAG: hypothetical protein OEM97_03525, partial [Acidimicrobiia bacterium]|nr:hypothetical protein [Acidimicrobiia bacterium]
MGHDTTARTLIVLGLALATVVGAALGLFALTAGREPLAADAASFQQAGCWNTVWGTDNDGFFFSVIATDDCPDFRGRVFAGEFQRGPTIRDRAGVAKMTGVDACTYETIEVKAVGADTEIVLYRFKWTADQLGCEPTASSTTTTTAVLGPPAQSPTETDGSERYSPFPGTLIEVEAFVDGCGLTVSGVGNATHDVTLNGIQKLTTGRFIAQPFFSFWVGPEGGDRWTASSFHAASLASDCSVQVFRTINDPAPQPTPVTEVPPVTATQPTAPSTTTTTLSAVVPTKTVASSGVDTAIIVQL